MSRWQPERLSFGIGLHSVSCCDASGRLVGEDQLRMVPTMTDAEKSMELTRAVDALVAAAGGNKRAAANVVVADSVARYWMLHPPEAVRSLVELQAVAEARCQQIFGAGQGWQVAGDWDARHPFLCAGLPAWIGGGLRELGTGLAMQAALPLALQRLAGRSSRSDGWLCFGSPGRFALLATVKGRLRSVRVLASDEHAPRESQLEAASQELRRESLRMQLPLQAGVQWWQLDGASFGATDTQVDDVHFLAQAVPLPTEQSAAGWSDARAAAVMAALV